MFEMPADARQALLRARAQRLSYAVRLVAANDGRIVAVLGEAHIKLAKASRLGNDVVAAFELRGVETFQRKQLTCGRTLGVFIQWPRAVLRALSLGAVKDSTIVDAMQLSFGDTVELERAKRMPLGLHVASIYMTIFFAVALLSLFVPLFVTIAPSLAAAVLSAAVAMQMHLLALVPGFFVRRYVWSWLVHPFLGILTLRDELMAAGTMRMLADHPTRRFAVLVMGRAHVDGVARLLIDRYGLVPVDL